MPDYENESALKVVQRIFTENFVRYRGQYALAILCMVIVAATTAYSAYIIKDVVNEVFDDKNLAKAYSIAGLILLIFFVKGMAGFGQEVLLKRISNNIVARYQKQVFDHILRLGVGYLSDTRSAFIVSQTNRNISGIQNMLNTVITTFARDLLTMIALIVVMVVQDPLMSVGSLLVMPIAAYVISRYVKRVKQISRRQVNLASNVVSNMVEAAQGISVVKAYTMETQLKREVGDKIKKTEKQSNTIALINARTKPLTETLGGFAIAGAVAFGGWRVIALDGNPGALLSFLAAAMLAYDPARRVASFRVQFENSLVNARMLYELLDTPPRQSDKPDASTIAIEGGEIKFDHVEFSYDGETPVLRDVSFTARAGEVTALVGPSGGGKSTIINTLLRFHDLQGGAIRVDGQNIADVKVRGLRENIAFVSQSPVMFEGSVADNILFGRPGASRDAIEEAARQAQAHDFIMAMPQGYDTPVGEMGANFSGGQKQRISIARAILRNAPILLLDEATSALDNESEKLVQRALEELMVGRTTIVIAHRLSTIRNADKIIVIDQGQIRETGSHADLAARPRGVYARLHRMGMLGTQEDEDAAAQPDTEARASGSSDKPAGKSARKKTAQPKAGMNGQARLNPQGPQGPQGPHGKDR
ncbi:MAG: ABC transporter ATP-binding protein [Nitratireductor sp.]|nr:ABC transporter ATP-binding protein [Nitratireductor sp.]